ncbi:MAG: hypothetical protein WBV72_06090, partial [Nitrososphaeraceae archaeon]
FGYKAIFNRERIMINVEQKGISARLSVIKLAFRAEYTNSMTGYVVVSDIIPLEAKYSVPLEKVSDATILLTKILLE